MSQNTKPVNVSQALLLRLKQLGIRYFFANPGTEFVSVIDGFVHLPTDQVPEPILCPHEFLAVSMAYGAYLATGKAQAVMTHATVGAANALIGLISAARMNIPLLMIAGKTAGSERSTIGHRDKLIHWAQESRDQGAMSREYVKWEIEVRDPTCLYEALDRAYAIAMSEPRGPVVLSLTREVLMSPMIQGLPQHIHVQATSPLGVPAILNDEVFPLLQAAKRPLILTNRFGIDRGAVQNLVEASERHGLGVVTPDDFYVSFPADHSNHLGFQAQPALAEADFVVVLDTEVPWYPLESGPSDSATVVHIGADPLCENIPLRSHSGQYFLRMGPSEFLRSLKPHPPSRERLAERKNWCTTLRKRVSPKAHFLSKKLSMQTVSAVVSEFLSETVFLVNELGLRPEALQCHHPGSYFRSGAASALGWGVGFGLGYALSEPKQTPLVAVGDGVFFLSPAHGALLVSVQRRIPFVLLILNNGGMRSISAATRGFYPLDTGDLPLTVLQADGVRLSRFADFVGGWGVRVESLEELRPALERALRFTKAEFRPAIVEVMVTN